MVKNSFISIVAIFGFFAGSSLWGSAPVDGEVVINHDDAGKFTKTCNVKAAAYDTQTYKFPFQSRDFQASPGDQPYNLEFTNDQFEAAQGTVRDNNAEGQIVPLDIETINYNRFKNKTGMSIENTIKLKFPVTMSQEAQEFLTTRASVLNTTLIEYDRQNILEQKIQQIQQHKVLKERIQKRKNYERWGYKIAAIGFLGIFAAPNYCKANPSVIGKEAPKELLGTLALVGTAGLATYLYNRFCGYVEAQTLYYDPLVLDTTTVEVGKGKGIDQQKKLAEGGLAYLNHSDFWKFADDKDTDNPWIHSTYQPKKKRIQHMQNILAGLNAQHEDSLKNIKRRNQDL